MLTVMPLFDYIRCPLNRWTFSIKPIREWVEKTCEGKTLNLFAGRTKLNIDEIRNDLDCEALADYRMDALQFIKEWSGEKFNTILLDPPYAYRKSMEMYKGIKASPFRQLKDEIPRILKPNGLVITFGYHCLDEETQCLTENGWKYYNELEVGIKVASFNRFTDGIEYVPIKSLFTYNYNGVLKSILDRYIDQLVTSNHKVVLKYKHQNNNKKGSNITWKDKTWELIECSSIAPHSGVYIPLAGLYKGKRTIGVPLAELIGWVISEGHMTPYRSIFIYQSNKTNREKVNRIRNLLEECKLFYREKTYQNRPDLVNFYISKRKNKEFYKIIDEVLIDVKTPKWSLLHLRHNELKALFTGLVLGDGSRYVDTGCIFYQKSNYTREWFQVLCLHLGYRTVNNTKNKVVNVVFTNEKCIAPGKRFKNTFSEVYYEGKVWCINVKNNCFLIRRNNKISITGNSNTMGKNRGFRVERIALFSHGGAIHDTIASVERYFV